MFLFVRYFVLDYLVPHISHFLDIELGIFLISLSAACKIFFYF